MWTKVQSPDFLEKFMVFPANTNGSDEIVAVKFISNKKQSLKW